MDTMNVLTYVSIAMAKKHRHIMITMIQMIMLSMIVFEFAKVSFLGLVRILGTFVESFKFDRSRESPLESDLTLSFHSDSNL